MPKSIRMATAIVTMTTTIATTTRLTATAIAELTSRARDRRTGMLMDEILTASLFHGRLCFEMSQETRCLIACSDTKSGRLL